MIASIRFRSALLSLVIAAVGCHAGDDSWSKAREAHCRDLDIVQQEVAAELETMTSELAKTPTPPSDEDVTRACVLALDHFDRIGHALERLRGSAGIVNAARPNEASAVCMDFGMSELSRARLVRTPSCAGGKPLLDGWAPQIAAARDAVTKKLAAASAECKSAAATKQK